MVYIVLYISNEVDGSGSNGKLENDSKTVGNDSSKCEEAESTDYEYEHSTKQ